MRSSRLRFTLSVDDLLRLGSGRTPAPASTRRDGSPRPFLPGAAERVARDGGVSFWPGNVGQGFSGLDPVGSRRRGCTPLSARDLARNYATPRRNRGAGVL